MKKIILFFAIILSGIYLINFISAISVNLNSGDTLTSDVWGKISNVTDKISVNGRDMKINGKIYISGDLCDNNGNCLGKCEADEYWDSASIRCKALNCSSQIIDDYDIGAINNGNNLAVNKIVSIANGDTTYTQTFACNMGELSKSGGETSAITCDIDYHEEGGVCLNNIKSCSSANASSATQTWSGTRGTCIAITCNSGYKISGNSCVPSFSCGSTYAGRATQSYGGHCIFSDVCYHEFRSSASSGTWKSGSYLYRQFGHVSNRYCDNGKCKYKNAGGGRRLYSYTGGSGYSNYGPFSGYGHRVRELVPGTY